MDNSKMNNSKQEKVDIKSMDMTELTEFIERSGDKKFRAKQIYQWLHQKLVKDFDEMTNLSVGLRDKRFEPMRFPMCRYRNLHA